MKDKKLSDEKARRSTGAATDTGDPKRIEDDARFQALLLDTVEQAVIAADFDGLITYWNKFAEKLFGWSAAEVLNKDVLKYTSSKISRRAAGKVMRQLQEGKNWTGELTLKRRDGATFPAQIMNSSVQNEHGDRIGMLSIITDISESRRAKKENIRLNSQIAAQRERLNTIIANIPGVVWETRLTANQADDCGFVSEYVEKMTGYTIAEWMQEPDFWLKIIHPEDREHAALEIAAFIENKGSGVQQCRWTAKDGAVVWVETQMVLIADDDGQPISLRGISIDVSGRKSMEEALQKSEEQLRQSQKLESVGRLAGGIAHDFNNMLTAINGYSDLILRELGDDDSLRKKVLEIKKAGERSAALTHQLLAFSRRQVLQPKLIDLNKIVTEMSQMLHRLIGEDVQLNLALDVAPSCVEADPGQLSQVIMNLVVNARDAMPQGGELTVETEKVFLKDEPVALFAASKTDEPFVML
ncbi:MAG: PAS domain S-box protein, partial [Acidobacteriota bacterium]|nr:PAS domain S-box protein [Acidobacteriota bacterium]